MGREDSWNKGSRGDKTVVVSPVTQQRRRRSAGQ